MPFNPEECAEECAECNLCPCRVWAEDGLYIQAECTGKYKISNRNASHQQSDSHQFSQRSLSQKTWYLVLGCCWFRSQRVLPSKNRSKPRPKKSQSPSHCYCHSTSNRNGLARAFALALALALAHACAFVFAFPFALAFALAFALVFAPCPCLLAVLVAPAFAFVFACNECVFTVPLSTIACHNARH